MYVSSSTRKPYKVDSDDVWKQTQSRAEFDNF